MPEHVVRQTVFHCLYMQHGLQLNGMGKGKQLWGGGGGGLYEATWFQ